MVGDESAQMTVLHGAGGDKATVLPTTEAGEGSFGRDTGAGQGTEAVTGGVEYLGSQPCATSVLTLVTCLFGRTHWAPPGSRGRRACSWVTASAKVCKSALGW